MRQYDDSYKLEELFFPQVIVQGTNQLLSFFVKHKQDLFGDWKAVDLTDLNFTYSATIKLFNDFNKLIYQGECSSLINGEFVQIADTLFPFVEKGTYRLEFRLSKSQPTIALVEPSCSIEILAVNPKAFLTGEFEVLFNNINLLSASQLTIGVSDTADSIATEIASLINLTNGDFDAVAVDNFITLTANTALGSALNGQSIIIPTSAFCFIGNITEFSGGVDQQQPLTQEYLLTDKLKIQIK